MMDIESARRARVGVSEIAKSSPDLSSVGQKLMSFLEI
jgi:hypothetical protein